MALLEGNWWSHGMGKSGVSYLQAPSWLKASSRLGLSKLLLHFPILLISISPHITASWPSRKCLGEFMASTLGCHFSCLILSRSIHCSPSEWDFNLSPTSTRYSIPFWWNIRQKWTIIQQHDGYFTMIHPFHRLFIHFSSPNKCASRPPKDALHGILAVFFLPGNGSPIRQPFKDHT